MSLPTAPNEYSVSDQSRLRSALSLADASNMKRGRDITLQPGQRLIVPEETTGALYRITIVAGEITATAL